MRRANSRKGIGHLTYALIIIGVVIILILITVILTRNNQLSSQAQSEVAYFDNQPSITTQSCTSLQINYERATQDISSYSQFVSADFFQNLSNQYLSQIHALNCPTS
jgi:hypothetical protein